MAKGYKIQNKSRKYIQIAKDKGFAWAGVLAAGSS